MSNLFASVSRDLLENGDIFICEYSKKNSFDYLSREGNFDKVFSYFKQINLRLTKTDDKKAFYLIEEEINEQSKKHTEQYIKKSHDRLRPIVLFFQAILNITGQDYAISAGQDISYATILTKITSTDVYKEDIANLYRLMTNSKSHKKDDISSKLFHILKFMIAEGLLIEKNNVEHVYTVTGKIGYVYECLQFIDDNEHIVDEYNKDEKKNKGDLF
jgi:hypothetical protein